MSVNADQEFRETDARGSVEDASERHPTYGRPRPRVGPLVARAGFSTFQELADALGVTREYLSRLRHGHEALGASTRRQLSELLGVPEDQALSALQEAPDARTPELDAHRLSLLSAVGARIEVLNDEQEGDEQEARAPLGPMVPHEQWTDLARAVGCSVRSLMRIRRGADVPNERMIEMLSFALLVPPEIALVAVRRRHTGWRW